MPCAVDHPWARFSDTGRPVPVFPDEVDLDIPAIEPRRFREAFEWVLAVHDRAAPFDAAALREAGEILRRVAGDRASPLQQVTLMVARQRFSDPSSFSAFLARVEALHDLLDNPAQVALWRARGWVRASPADTRLVAPAHFLVETAALCPLGPAGFDQTSFEALAQRRADRAGPPPDRAASGL